MSRTIREDGLGDDIHVRDGATQRWRGGALVDAAIDFCVKHKPETFHIEGIPGTDMFCDFFLLKCGLAGIEPPLLDAFKPHQMKGAKNHRIRMLPTLFEINPPALKLYQGPYLWALMEEAENFIPSAQNSGRQVGLLDVLALAIFGGM